MPRGIIFHMRKKNLYFAVVLHLYVDVSLVDRPRLAGGITIICGRYFRSSSLVYVVFGIFVMYDVVFGYW
jgi:thymidylate kinase